MASLIRNERGISLVEVLATISLLSIVGVIIWQVFFQGYQYSQKAISKNLMLQEANIINTSLLKIHQKVDQYELSNSDSNCGITATYNGQSQVFTHPNICFSFNPNEIIPGTVEPYLEDVSLTLTASERHNPNNKVTIESRLFRMKGGNY